MTKKKKKNNFITLNLIILILVFFVLKFYIHFQNSQLIPIVETLNSEQKKIPQDVRNASSKTPITATINVPILMYHYVENVTDIKDTIRISLNISPYVFEKQLITLKNAGYTFLTAKDLGQILDNHIDLPRKPILLTFDDGHWDFYTDVFPLLKKYNIKATVYIVPGFTGGSDSLSELQIKELSKSPLVEIGAHTIHHIALKDKLYSAVKNEVMESKKILEEKYRINVVSFAYPNGSFDQQAIDIVKNSGFRTAVSTIKGTAVNQKNRFYLSRLRPGNKIGDELITFLQSNF